MGFGIIRARNLSAGDISDTDKHNSRRYSNKNEYPENIKPNGEYEALYQTEIHNEFLYKDQISLKEALDIRLKENNVKGIRKNSNVAIEYVCTINDKKAWKNYSFDGYASNTKQWLEGRHGNGSVIATYKHLDESNPHVHFVVVPLEIKEIKWKNQRSQGVRKETRLNTRKFTGGREKLRALQDDYFQHLSEKYGVGEDNKLGVPLYRGTLAEENFQKYSQQTDHKIGDLRNELEKIKDEALRKKKELEIIAKQAEFVARKRTFENESKKKNEYNRKNWEKKGTRDNSIIFHSDSKTKKKGRKI